jgi:hypothetical protein
VIDPEGEEWLTLTEVVKVTGAPLGTLSVWVTRGAVRSHRVGTRRWVSVDDVLARQSTSRRSRNSPSMHTWVRAPDQPSA